MGTMQVEVRRRSVPCGPLGFLVESGAVLWQPASRRL